MRSARRASTLLVGALALMLLLAFSAIALAAGPKKGATYGGKTAHQSDPITLKVSGSGKAVTAAEVIPPAYCQGGSAGVKQITKPAAVSKSGGFSAVISYEFEPEHKIIAKLYVKGTFNGKKVKGTARSEFLLAHQCNGSTSFSAATK